MLEINIPLIIGASVFIFSAVLLFRYTGTSPMSHQHHEHHMEGHPAHTGSGSAEGSMSMSMCGFHGGGHDVGCPLVGTPMGDPGGHCMKSQSSTVF